MSTATNLHIYPNYFLNETRMLKETASLSQANVFDQIYIAAVWKDGLEETQQLGFNRQVIRLKLFTEKWGGPIGKVLRLLEWSARVLSIFRKKRITVINSHALTTLPLGVLFKFLTGSKLVYDTHELETETHGSRGLRKLVAKIVERALIRFVDSVIVVSPSIADWYRRVYRLQNVFLVRNLPYFTAAKENKNDHSILRARLNISSEDLVFMYQGIFGPGRNIELYLEAWSDMPQSHHLVFMGNGTLEPLITAAKIKSSNIHLHPAVPLNEILSFTQGADVGLALFENSCLNYYYVLPNKLFEYIFANVPVIVSDFPDMGTVVDEFRCGWKTAVNRNAFVSLVRSIDRSEIAIRREGTKSCRAVSGWHIEEQTLLNAYDGIVPTKANRSTRKQ